MQSYFAKYLKLPIFESQGLAGPACPSRIFNSYFKDGNVDYIGKGKRFAKMSEKEILNNSFYTFLKEKGYEVPISYQMVATNMEASFKSISKYDRRQPDIALGPWLQAGEWTKQHFYFYMGGSHILPKEDVLSEMDKTTSCGYPWSRLYHKKSEFLADDVISRVLDDFYDEIADSETSVIPIWTCSQKVELRSIEKIRKNDIRTFTGSPIEFSVSTNRLCLHMNNKFYEAANRSWSCVGISKFLSGWNSIFDRLKKHPNAFELDESQFDSSLFEKALLGQRDIRWQMLQDKYKTPENWNRMNYIYYHIIHSFIILENGEIIQKHTGNPSGSSNTVVDNTMILYRLFAYAWIILCEEQGIPVSYTHMMENVEAALYGDDNTFTASDEVVGWFNPTNISRIWTAIGVKTKTPSFESRKLEEVSFLSQGFSYNQELSMYVPCPEKEKVLCSLLYGSTVDDIRWHLLRAYALRIDSYGNRDCRRIISEYIEYIHATYKDQLVGVVNEIPMKDILAGWKSDDFIEALYSGFESSEVYKLHGTALNSIIDIEYKQSKIELKMAKRTKQVKRVKKTVAKIVKKAIKHSQPKKSHSHGSTNGGISMGQRVGKFLGGHAQNMISKITGLGDYHVSGAGGIRNDNGPPQFAPGRTPRIAHREYLGDITSSIDFNANTYNLNPGDPQTFPWLEKIAKNFEEYKFHGLVFEFKSTSATALNSVNTALGTVVMATQYDSVEPTFSNKRTMENHEFASSTMPYQSVLHAVETKPSRTSISTNLYVLAGAQPPDTDIRLYNLGKFTIATVGMQAASNIGELWVSYDIEFFKPQLLDIGDANVYAHYSTNSLHGSQPSVSPFGQASSIPNGGYGMNMVPSSGSTDLISFAQSYDEARLPNSTYWWDTLVFKTPGTYLVSCVWMNPSTGVPDDFPPALENVVGTSISGLLYPEWYAEPYFYSTSNVGRAAGTATLTVVLQTNQADAKARLLITPSATSNTGTWWFCVSDVVVVPLPSYFQHKYSRIEMLEKRLEDLLKHDQITIPSTPEEEKFTPVNMSESTVLARALSKLSQNRV